MAFVKQLKMKKWISIAVLLVWAISCKVNPITGRRQLQVVPNSQLIPLSFQNYEEVLKGSKVITQGKEATQIQRVGNKIRIAVETYFKDKGLESELAGFDWQFSLIEEDVLNAWCMPGGKVAFYTGILPVCKDDAGIATVMGHEIAHAVANHGGERMSQGLIANLGLSALSVAIEQKPTLTNQVLLQAAGVGTQLGMLKFSRSHESESDQMGLIFMAMAGYDPHEAPKFWERMNAASGGAAPPEFLSTHPHPQTRIKDLNKWMPEAMKYYKK
jgi:predicted Zn-dependent protease